MNETLDTNQTDQERKTKTPKQRAEQVARINEKLQKAMLRLDGSSQHDSGQEVVKLVNGQKITISNANGSYGHEISSSREYQDRTGESTNKIFDNTVFRRGDFNKSLDSYDETLLEVSTTASKLVAGGQKSEMSVNRYDGSYEPLGMAATGVGIGVATSKAIAERGEAKTLNAIRGDISKVRGAQKAEKEAKAEAVLEDIFEK